MDKALVSQQSRIASVRDHMLNLSGRLLVPEGGSALDEKVLTDWRASATYLLQHGLMPEDELESKQRHWQQTQQQPSIQQRNGGKQDDDSDAKAASEAEAQAGRDATTQDRNSAINRHSADALAAVTEAIGAVSHALFCEFDAVKLKQQLAMSRTKACSVVDELRAMELVVEDEEARQVRAEWQKLLKGASKTTTKRAFQATQPPSSWRPEEMKDAEGLLTADPLRVLQAERDRLNGLW